MPSPPSSDNTGTMSSFHPEFESTQQFDTATQELNLRASAQRFGYYQPPSPQLDMNSSLVRDSFPEFTEKSPSPGASVSIEMGRGARARSPRHMDVSDIVLPEDSLYDLQTTPPVKTRSTPNRKTDSLRKEASVRRAQSGDKKANASQRRSLSDMHRKVNQESDSSFIGEDRPTTQTVNPRNTRFTSAQMPTTYSRDHGLQTDDHTPRRPLVNPTATWTGTHTQQSFMLPDLPNITELVSGVRKDGTPVFSRSAKSRSRFTNPTITNTLTHHKINSIAVPDDEKAIFASLQLLKDKVASLEMEKSESQQRLEEYESEVAQLKSRVEMEQKLRRPDSALGDDDEPSAREKWRVERGTLQSTIKTLQERLTRSGRNLSVSDIAVKRMTQERDDLVTQLGVAYYSSEELNNENQNLQADAHALRSENAQLRLKLGQIKAQFDDETQHWNLRESNLKAKIQRREAAVRELHDMTLRSAPLQDETAKSIKTSTSRIPQQEDYTSSNRRSSGRLGQDTKHRILDRIENEIKRSRSAAAPAATLRDRSRSKSNTRQSSSNPSRRTSGPTQPVDDVSDAESTTNLDFSRTTRNDTREDDDSRDITYLSFLDPKELARLRKTLEEERRAAKTSRAASAPPVQENATVTEKPDLPRKSSLRDVAKDETGHFTARIQMDENTGLLKNVRIQSPHMSDAISYDEPKEMTDASMLSTSSRRRQRSKSIEEMTSAFILPDITLHTRPGASMMDNTTLSHMTHANHDQTNCTLCPSKDSQVKEVTIPKPIPVSEREIDDTNATIRPSQPPPVALATVLKQLEDEVTHLKLQLATYEKGYHSHDPALGKRKRRAVKEKMDTLVSEIERRSDQVYALYDVLEGQKADAGEDNADDEQIEETLQSLGIDAEELAQRDATRTVGARARNRKNGLVSSGLDGLFEDEEEDDLPWEGISDDSEFEDVRLPKLRSAKAGRV